jgi:hypothetical protein
MLSETGFRCTGKVPDDTSANLAVVVALALAAHDVVSSSRMVDHELLVSLQNVIALFGVQSTRSDVTHTDNPDDIPF